MYAVAGPGWALTALGLGCSMLLLLSLALKWKLPLRQSLIGSAGAALLAGLALVWLAPLTPQLWGELAPPGLGAGRGPTGASSFTMRSMLTFVAFLVFQVGLALVLGLAAAMVAFWRDPERVPPQQDGAVLSPADGEVIYIRATDNDGAPLVTKGGADYRLRELLGTPLAMDPAVVIAVEMNLLNVHVNRCPVAGRVGSTVHTPGAFLSLRRPEAPFLNTRLTTVIENPALTVAVVQVASRLVRRIQGYLRAGQEVAAGQRLGMIRFGSLVAVVLPLRDDVRIAVQPGDRVTAGVSILAHYGEAVGSPRSDPPPGAGDGA